MDLVVSAGQVLVGPVGERVADGAVLVSDGVIAAVGPRADVESQAGPDVRRVDCPHGTVLPGLINAHVHLAFDASADPVTALRATDDADLLLGMAHRARQLLDTGVTTARDLGDRSALSIRLRNAIRDGLVPGPRILAAAAPLTPTGGHCWFMGGEVGADGTDRAESIREVVRRNVADGADVIKVMATGGQMTPSGAKMWEAQFTVDELRMIVEEARAAGLPVAAHAHGTEGIAAAVEAGVDTLEHCSWMTVGPQGPGFDRQDEVAKQIAARGIAVCPTLSHNWARFREFIGHDRAEQLYAQIGWMDEVGIRLMSGTDAGVPRSTFDNFVGSLGVYSYLGFGPAKIIELATSGAADGLGIGADTGRVAVGHRADLLVVQGDPLADLEALREIVVVVAGGRPHVPTAAALPAN